MKPIRLIITAIFLLTSALVHAQDLEITHSPRETARAGERVRLRIKVNNPDNIDFVRLYFRSDLNSKFNFVETKQLGKYIFAGQLPAASKDAKLVEYAFLVRDKSKKIVKTQKFKYKVQGEIPLVKRKVPVKVFSEQDKAPKAIAGFDDNMEMDVAESGAKLALVAGLYETEATKAAASSSTATKAAGGISTTVLAAAGAGGAALVGIAASGGGSGSSSNNPTIYEFRDGQYSGAYSWDCQDGNNTGEIPVILDLQDNNGEITGIIDYSGSQVSITGTYDSVTRAISFEIPASENTVQNSFSGYFNSDGSLLEGQTTRGEDGTSQGCYLGGTPAGSIAARIL